MNFRERAGKMGFHLTSQQEQQFATYSQLLRSWNEHMDLTNLTEEKEIENRHFLDSLSIVRLFPFPLGGRWIDIGTGAGFPGIPLKIMNPQMEMILLDSLQKRVRFLREVIQTLNLCHVVAIHGRAEELLAPQASVSSEKTSLRESFDFVISRAVAPLPTLLEYALPAVRPDGVFIAMKGPAAKSELNESEKALSILGGKVEKIDSFEWTEEHFHRTNLVIRKINHTPSDYPRKGAKARKRPIGSH